ncbi:MAG: ATP-binding protein [Lachnospiraceae bacterium]|nr:ATP-binding protein [Lachnospiraceae bacterium]
MALSNSQYNQILAAYDEKHYKRKHLETSRLKEIYTKIPKYQELDNAIASLNVEKGKLLLHGDIDKAALTDERINEIRQKKQSLLCEYGFGAHYLNIPYECDICKDTGFVNDSYCTCFNRLASVMFCKETMSREGFEKHSFDNFNYDLYDNTTLDKTLNITPYENAKNNVKKAKEFISDFTKEYDLRSKKNLFIYGNTGVGKTYLSNCIAKELIESGYSVMYVSAPNLFELLSDYNYNKDTDNTDLKSRITKIKNDDLLILDDLGTEFNNSYTLAQLYQLINDRLNKGLSTVITSNIHLNEIKPKYDERIYSRIVGNYCFIKLLGKDLRLLSH